jgi:uncharacterized membrane protein YdjX (TVP38/TMEM64 family)
MRNTKLRFIVGFLLVSGAAVALCIFPVRDFIVKFLEWADGLGPWGSIVLAAGYIPACLSMVPGSLLTLGAGLAFGLVLGTIAVSIGAGPGSLR